MFKEARSLAAIWSRVCLLCPLGVMLSLTDIGVVQTVPSTPPVGLTATAATEGVGLDQGVQLEGELEIIHEDFKDGRGRYLYSLKLSDGTRVPLQFLKEPPTHLLTGDHVRAKGQLSNGTLVLYSGSPNAKKTTGGSTSSIPVPYTFGAQSTIVILVNFLDDTQEPYTVADVQNAFFGTGSTLSGFALENSYGQTSFVGDVYGWFTVPLTTANCTLSAVATDAQNAAVAAGADLSKYTRQVYVFPVVSSCSGEGFGGASTVGGNPSQAWINGYLWPAILYHEMGHSFGLYHSHWLDCGTSAVTCTNGTIVEYGDAMDTMAMPGGNLSPDYNAFQKERLGWLNYGASPAIQTVTTSGTYTISPYENGAGPNALKVLQSTNPTTGAKTWYYLEGRRAIGFDSYVTGPCCPTQNETAGVLFHLGTDGDGNSSLMLDMTPSTPTNQGWYDMSLAVGQSFSDPTAGVTFATTAADSTGATLSITVGEYIQANPSVTVSPSDPSIYPGQTASYTVTVTNNDSAGCSSSTFNLSSGEPSGWSTSYTASSLTLSPGKSGTATMGKGSPSGTGPGTYAVKLTAATSTQIASATANATVMAAPSLAVSVAVSGSTFTSGQRVSFTANVLSGGAAAGGVSVTFTMTKAGGSTAIQTVNANSSGVATWNYRFGKNDPKGTWSVLAQASYNSQTATSNAVTFTVQ